MITGFQQHSEIYSLNGSSIDEISRDVQKQLAVLKYEKRNNTGIRLLIEEILLKWKAKFGEDALCSFAMEKRFRKPYILLELEGEKYNPLEKNDELFGEWGQHLLDGLGFHPTFTYTNGKNTVRFELKAQKPGNILMIMIAVLAAIVFGLLGNLLPESVRVMLTTEVLSRFSELFYSMLGVVAGPLVFLSVLTGICNIGDTATLGTMGKTVVSGFTRITFFTALLSGIIFPFIFNLQFGNAAGTEGISDMTDMLFGIVPGNLVSPFLEGNCLQIIVLAVAFGIAVLIIGKSANGLVNIVEQLNSVVRTVMSWISSLIPYFIFVLLLQNMWSGSFSALLQSWKPFVLSIVFSALLAAFALIITSLRQHMSIRELVKSIIPATLIAFTTSSSMAALGESISGCESNFGIQKKLANFALPISTMLCVPSNTISFIACVLYSMSVYHIELSVASAALMIVSVTLLLIAAPPVPGGILSCYAVVFAQLGIPAEAIAAVLTLDVILDFPNSAVNMAVRQLALTAQAKKLKMIDNSKIQNIKKEVVQ